MATIITDILPKRTQFAKVNEAHDLNYKAICIYLATGFFLDSDTYWRDEVCLSSGHEHTIDDHGVLVESKPWFEWQYNPNDNSFDNALEEYVSLLTDITKDQIGNENVILPLSGGLDSRSQALILKNLGNPVHAYSYSFKGGYPEHRISKKIAQNCGFTFDAFQIGKSYLWNEIDELAQINRCYSEFTHPRQMAILKEFGSMNGVFSLGHWGDVFFDRGVPKGTQEHSIIPLLLYKMVKKGGMELAEEMWKTWGLDGDFKSYLIARIEKSLSKIKTDNLSAKVRAFKTSQWAHRWTTTNLSVFEKAHPISLPYYDNRMCEFISKVPEEYLADRKLQIAHLKQDKALSNITWHAQKPFNINNYRYNKSPYNLPYRITNKLKREFNTVIGNPHIQRNWELQFLGTNNDIALREYLFSEPFTDFIPKFVIQDFYDRFTSKNQVYYSHSVSMLLTLSLWHKHFYNN